MITTIDCIFSSRFSQNSQANPADTFSKSHKALNYRKSAFNSTNLRLISMEKRMSNLIQLSFNLVTQQDSRSFKIDNKLMKLIAMLTLVFLPTSTIASIFGTQFFTFNQPQHDPTNNNNSASDTKVDMLVSHQFWIFWVLVGATTVLVCSLSWVHFHRMKKSITVGLQPKRTPTGFSELLHSVV